MVSATGLGATPWHRITAADHSDEPGRSARLHLGSAEISAKMLSGYGDDGRQVVLETHIPRGGGRDEVA